MITKRYTIVRTSFGDLYITADHNRLQRIGMVHPHIATAMRNDQLPLLRKSAHALLAYLNGEATAFDADFSLHGLPFRRDVFDAVGQIPYGQTASSKEIAQMIGKPHAVRAVETVCRTNPLYIAIPSHRVILTSTPHTTALQLAPPDEVLRKLEKRYLDKAVKRR